MSVCPVFSCLSVAVVVATDFISAGVRDYCLPVCLRVCLLVSLSVCVAVSLVLHVGCLCTAGLNTGVVTATSNRVNCVARIVRGHSVNPTAVKPEVLSRLADDVVLLPVYQEVDGINPI